MPALRAVIDFLKMSRTWVKVMIAEFVRIQGDFSSGAVSFSAPEALIFHAVKRPHQRESR
ncbi:hypothetical protein GI582_24155 [Sulfitobacter sp. BDSS02]|nr:hypothetical protein [Sulfitobacter sp. BDSS02]